MTKEEIFKLLDELREPITPGFPHSEEEWLDHIHTEYWNAALNEVEHEVSHRESEIMETRHPICFHCGNQIIWQADFSADEYGFEDELGIIHSLHCPTCGAEVTYYIPSREAQNEE